MPLGRALCRRGPRRLAVGFVAVAVAGALTGALAGCGPVPSSASDGRLLVATTVAPITSIVANVGGEHVRVEGIVPEGTNSHTFEPPPSTAKLLSRADVIFVNGLQLEDPTVELARANRREGTPIVELGTTVLPPRDYIFDFSFPREDGKPNPHLWTDPTYAIKYAEVVATTLGRRDPEHAQAYRQNLTAFVTKATALSDAVQTATASIPPQRRLLLTYHDAYAYFARTYGWRVVGAVQPKDFEDPSPKEVKALIDQIRRENVPVVFGSEVFPSKVLEQIARESGSRYEASLRDDDLPGRPGDPEHSWLGLMRYDFITMVSGLGGDPAALRAVDIGDVVPDRAVYPQ